MTDLVAEEFKARSIIFTRPTAQTLAIVSSITLVVDVRRGEDAERGVFSRGSSLMRSCFMGALMVSTKRLNVASSLICIAGSVRKETSDSKKRRSCSAEK